MTDLHQTRTVPAKTVRPHWEVREQGEWALVVGVDFHGDMTNLSLGSQENVYPYGNDEPVAVRIPVSRFVVEVTGCAPSQAARVMQERLGHDEDYGFDYQVDWAVTS